VNVNYYISTRPALTEIRHRNTMTELI